MWRILATTVLLFYVSPITAREKCDLVNLKVCISDVKKNPTIESTNYCKYSKENKSCYESNHCTKDDAYSDVLKEIKKNCDKQPRRSGPVTTTKPKPRSKLKPTTETTIKPKPKPTTETTIKPKPRSKPKPTTETFKPKPRSKPKPTTETMTKPKPTTETTIKPKPRKKPKPTTETMTTEEPICDKNAFEKCTRKLDKSDACNYWKQKQGCYETAGCGLEGDYVHVISEIKKRCRTGPRKAIFITGCDWDALADCRGKIAKHNPCTYWKRIQECYKAAGCGAEDRYVHVISKIHRSCRRGPVALVAKPDCQSNALAECRGKIDKHNSCTYLKGKFKCYTETQCFDDEINRQDMKKKMNKACDCPCKMRSSCVVLVVMLALIKYLD